MRKFAQDLLDVKVSDSLKESRGNEMLTGIRNYLKHLDGAKVLKILFGVVRTKGKLTYEGLNDPNDSFRKRADHCVKSLRMGFISNPCMKLFYFIDNGILVAELIEMQMAAELVIAKCMEELKVQCQNKGLDFDTLAPGFLNTLEETSLDVLLEEDMYSISPEHIEKLTDNLILPLVVNDHSDFTRFKLRLEIVKGKDTTTHVNYETPTSPRIQGQ